MELKTKIVIRNDSSTNWLTNEATVLLKGEVGIEFLADGKVKMKVGDGIKTWAELSYFGGDEAKTFTVGALSEITETNLAVGDTAIVKTLIPGTTDKYSYTGYVYNGTAWGAMDGNYNADNVFLTEDITLAGDYTQVGNLTKTKTGTATFATAGKSVSEAFLEIFSKRLQPGTPTAPAVSLTFSQAKAYEVGTEVTPSYSASLSDGAYTYGPEPTGVTATAWEVSATGVTGTKNTSSGSFDKFTVADDTNYKITAKATHTEGLIAKDNLGSDSNPIVKIASGSKSATSGAVTGYRNSFYGTVTSKDNAPDSAIIRTLTKSNKALANGNTFTVSIPTGALRVIIAYPATLRDVTSIKDVNGLNAEIKSGFTLSTVSVEGANGFEAKDYKVYTMDYANPNDKANSYTVQI